jgi:hypothetical protein
MFPVRGVDLLDLQPLVAIVDDDESVRRALARLLRSAGYAIASFEGGAEFLRSPDGADCLLLDLDMPGMDGPDVVGAPRGARDRDPDPRHHRVHESGKRVAGGAGPNLPRVPKAIRRPNFARCRSGGNSPRGLSTNGN